MITIAKQTYDGMPVMGLKKPSKLTPPTNNGPIKEVLFCTVQSGGKSVPYLRLLDYINLLTDISNF